MLLVLVLTVIWTAAAAAQGYRWWASVDYRTLEEL